MSNPFLFDRIVIAKQCTIGESKIFCLSVFNSSNPQQHDKRVKNKMSLNKNVPEKMSSKREMYERIFLWGGEEEQKNKRSSLGERNTERDRDRLCMVLV